MGQFTLLLRLAPPFSVSPAVARQVAVSIQAHTSLCHVGMSVLFCAAGWDGAEMETNAEVWVPHTDWRRRVHPQSSVLLHSQLPLVIYCHSAGTAVLDRGAAQWYQYDNMTVLWCGAQFPEPALDHQVLLCTCSQCPSLMPGWGWWPGCFSTGRKSGQRQVHPPSVLSPQLTRFLLLSSIRAVLSWSSLHEEGTCSTLDPDGKWMRGKTTEDLSVPLTGTSVSAVKFPEMKDIQQANSALAFSFSRKRSKISNHGRASLTGTWWPGHTLIRINDRR